jgi:hypothetical protein
MGFNTRKMEERRRKATEGGTPETEKLCLQSHPA